MTRKALLRKACGPGSGDFCAAQCYIVSLSKKPPGFFGGPDLEIISIVTESGAF